MLVKGGPGDIKSFGITSYGMDLVLPEYCGFSSDSINTLVTHIHPQIYVNIGLDRQRMIIQVYDIMEQF